MVGNRRKSDAAGKLHGRPFFVAPLCDDADRSDNRPSNLKREKPSASRAGDGIRLAKGFGFVVRGVLGRSGYHILPPRRVPQSETSMPIAAAIDAFASRALSASLALFA